MTQGLLRLLVLLLPCQVGYLRCSNTSGSGSYKGTLVGANNPADFFLRTSFCPTAH